jgi:hypothetical protein
LVQTTNSRTGQRIRFRKLTTYIGHVYFLSDLSLSCTSTMIPSTGRLLRSTMMLGLNGFGNNGEKSVNANAPLGVHT